MSDLINHMARLYIIADGGSDPVLARMYHPVWHVIPNLAIDLIGPPLIKLTSVSTAARILLALGLLLCLLGTIAFHRATFGARSYWPLAVGLVVYNGEFLLGFMNFIIGTGMALLFAAAAMSKNQMLEKVRLPLSCVAAIVIFFCHGWALLFYFLLLGIHELFNVKLPTWQRDLSRSAFRLVVPAIIPAILLHLSPPSHVDQYGWISLTELFGQAISPFTNYNPVLDAASLCIVLGMIGFLVFRNILIVPRTTALTFLLLGLLFILCPWSMRGATFFANFLNTRFAFFMALMLFAGIRPDFAPRPEWRLPAFSLLTLLFVVRIGVIADVWHASQRDINDMRGLGAALPPGGRVLATRVVPDEDRAKYFHDQPAGRQLRGLFANFWFLPSLWVIEQHVFFPLLFTNPLLQPLEVTDAYRSISSQTNAPPDYRALYDPILAANEAKQSPYFPGWQQHFDYVVVLSAGRAEHLDGLDSLPLVLIGKTDIAALYRVVR